MLRTCVWLMIASAQLCSGGGWRRSRASLGEISITLGGSWGSSSSACCQLTCHATGIQQMQVEHESSSGWCSSHKGCRARVALQLGMRDQFWAQVRLPLQQHRGLDA